MLNSKSEYNRCKIGRLTIGDDVDEERKFRKRAEQLGQDEEELEEGAGEKRMMDWERTRLVDRRLQEVQGSGTLRRGVSRSPARKRRGEENTSKKKRKFPLLGENWGLEATEQPLLPPPLAPKPPPPPPTTPGVQVGEQEGTEHQLPPPGRDDCDEGIGGEQRPPPPTKTYQPLPPPPPQPPPPQGMIEDGVGGEQQPPPPTPTPPHPPPPLDNQVQPPCMVETGHQPSDNDQLLSKDDCSNVRKTQGGGIKVQKVQEDNISLRECEEHPDSWISGTEIRESPPPHKVVVMETPLCSILSKDRSPLEEDMRDSEVRSRGQHSSTSDEPSKREEDVWTGYCTVESP